MKMGFGRLVVSCAALALLLLLPACQTNGETKTEDSSAGAAADQKIKWLFVMTARTGSFDGKNLVLHDVPPTLMFSDRPYRVWGHMDTAHLVKSVSKGPDSFAEDPPNAVLSTFGGGMPTEATVVLYAPRLSGRTISFPVKVQEGEIPGSFSGASLFIDRWCHPHPHPHIGAFVVGAAVGHAVTRANQPSTVVVTEPTHYYAVTPTTSSEAQLSPEDKLVKLKDMHEKGLITDSEYETKRKQVLDDMN